MKQQRTDWALAGINDANGDGINKMQKDVLKYGSGAVIYGLFYKLFFFALELFLYCKKKPHNRSRENREVRKREQSEN